MAKGLDVRKFSFKMRVTDQWNNLPEDVVKVKELTQFKNRLDKLCEVSDVYYNPECGIQLTTSAR